MITVGLERIVFLFTWRTKTLPDAVHYPDIRLPPVNMTNINNRYTRTRRKKTGFSTLAQCRSVAD